MDLIVLAFSDVFRPIQNTLLRYDNWYTTQFLGFTMQIRSKSEWGSTSTVLMFVLYWKEQMIGNCTYLLRNTRPTHLFSLP